MLTKPTFDVHYDEGLKVGYKWYDAEKKPVLFPFGYGLSYTTYSYSDLKVTPGEEHHGHLHREEHRQPRRSRKLRRFMPRFPPTQASRRSAWWAGARCS